MQSIWKKAVSLMMTAAVSLTCLLAGWSLPVTASGETGASKVKVDLSEATLTATGEHTRFPLQALVDGKTTTGWSSDPNTLTQNSHEWVMAKLPTATFLDELRLYPRYETVSGEEVLRCFPLDFTIQVSSDGNQWKTVSTQTDYTPTGNEWQIFTFDLETAVQYIKVDATKLYTENPTASTLSYRCQFMEMEAYYTAPEGVAAVAAAIDAVAVDETNSCLLYPTLAGLTVSLKSTTDPDVVDTDGTVDTVNSGSCSVVLTVSDGTTSVDTAPITVTVVGLAAQEAVAITASTATASTEANSSWGVSRLIDGNKTSSNAGWSSKQHKTATPANDDGAEWAMLTLSKTALIKRVDVYPRNRTTHRGLPTDFEIQVSEDGVTWTTAYRATEYAVTAYNAMQSIEITPTYGRYVRLWCTKLCHDGDGYSVQLAEMEVFGLPMTLQSTQAAADGLTVKPVAEGDTAVSWQSIDNRFFKVRIEASSHPAVVALDRSITLPSTKTEVTLTLKVINRLNKTDTVTVQRQVTVNSPNGLLAETAAQSVDLLPLPDANATTMPMPTLTVENAEAFDVTIESSSRTDIVATDGTITRPRQTTGVTLTLRVTHRASGEYALTKELLVPIYKTYTAPTMTDQAVDAQLDKFEQSALGIFVHYVPAVTDTKEAGKIITSGTVYADGSKVTEVDDLADHFDAEQFAKELNDFGAEYVMFTVWHADMRTLFPSMTNQRWRDDRRTDDTVGMKSYADSDLIAELIEALAQYDIDLYLYTHPSDGHDLTAEDQTLTGWNDSTDQYATWNQYINELYYELCERYGTNIKGLYFDGWYNHVPTGAPQQRLRETCLSFNPAMALIMNTGFDQLVDPAPGYNGADYRAWEIRRTDLETLKVSHNQSCMIIGGEWFTTSAQTTVPDFTYNSAASIYRYTALLSTISTHGGFAASLAVYPERDGEELNDLWAYGIYDLMTDMKTSYLDGVQESVKQVIPSAAYPTAEESTLATLSWGAASESQDGKTLYLHVLTAPDGDELTLPATADGSGLADTGSILNFDGTVTEGVTLTASADGGYTVRLPQGVSWNTVDTVIKVALDRPTATGVTLSTHQTEIYPGNKRSLGFTLSPTGAATVDVCWESSDHSVVTVDRDGTLTAVNRGTATVTLTVNGVSDTCSVTVTEQANLMGNGDFEGADPNLDWHALGGTVTAGVGRNQSAGLVRNTSSFYLKGQNFTLLPNRYYEFSLYFKGETGDVGKVWYNTGTADNNNRDVAPITSTRAIGAVDADGWRQYTCVLATGDDPQLVSNYAIALSNFLEGTVIDDISLRLLPELTDLVLNESSLELLPGFSVTLTAVPTPAEAYAGAATWVSSNGAVATVDSTGKITGVSEGVAVITATVGTISRTCTVTVSPYANVILNGNFELGATAEWGNNTNISKGVGVDGGYALAMTGTTQGEQYYKGKFFAALEENTEYVLLIDYKNVGGGYPEVYLNYGGKGTTVNGDEMIQATKLTDCSETWQTKAIFFRTGTINHSNSGWELALIRRVDRNLVDGSAAGTSYFDNLRIVKLNGAYVSEVKNGTLTLSNGSQSGTHLDGVDGKEITVSVIPQAGYQLVPGSLRLVTADGTVKRILNKAEAGFGEGDGTQFTITVPDDTTVAVKAEFAATASNTVQAGTIGTSLYRRTDDNAPVGVRFLTRMYVEGWSATQDTLTVRYQGREYQVIEFGSLLKRSANPEALTLETVNANLNATGQNRTWKSVAYTAGGAMKLVDYTAAYLDFTVIIKKGADVTQENFEQREYTVCGYVVLDDGTVLYTEPMTDSVTAAIGRGA